MGSIPWRRKWLPAPVFLPGEFHGQRSLEGYSSWGDKKSDAAEQLTHASAHSVFMFSLSAVFRDAALFVQVQSLALTALSDPHVSLVTLPVMGTHPASCIRPTERGRCASVFGYEAAPGCEDRYFWGRRVLPTLLMLSTHPPSVPGAACSLQR